MSPEILLVDDNPGDRELVGDVLLRMFGAAKILSLKDGEEAVSFLRREGKYIGATEPGLIVLDLEMPRKDGRAVLIELKSNPQLRRIPVVIFSSSRTGADVQTSYQLGANSYVSKPGTLTEFIAAVSSIGQFWLGCATLPTLVQ